MKTVDHPPRWLRSFGATVAIIFAIFFSGAALADPPTLCGKDGYGETFNEGPPYRSGDDKFREYAEQYEQKMRTRILQEGRPLHVASRASPRPLKLSLEAQERFFAEIFAASGDIPRVCGTMKLIAEEARSTAAVNVDPAVTQCQSLKEAEAIRARADTSLESMRRELREKFGDPRKHQENAPSGTRFTQLARAKTVNEKELGEAGLPRAPLSNLRRESAKLWGDTASDEQGLFSSALTQGAREFGRAEALAKQLSTERTRLGAAIQKCGTTTEARPPAESNGRDHPDSGASRITGGNETPPPGPPPAPPSPPPAAPAKGENFLEQNWPWLAGGAGLAAVGGGAYLFHEYKTRQADDAKAQAAWSEEIALRAAQNHDGSSIETSTSTSTSTSTGTDTSTGLPAFAPLKYSVAELETLELSFSAADASALTLAGAPADSVWEASTATFRWLPGLGRAGTYSFSISSAKGKQGVEITVSARDRQAFGNGGPPDNFRDGDIGYVFVHGAGGTVDRCAAGNDLFEYWGAGPNVVAPDANSRKLACYDGREDVASQAKRVAEQIDGFDCGRYRKCILITHSMGGLMIEHLFTHAEAAPAGDANAKLYENHALYRKVRDKTLFVISLASAAGGSKVADILISGRQTSALQKASGLLARNVGSTNNAYRNLQSKYASEVVAPVGRDPGVPFFMVPGYSKKTLYEERGLFDIIGLDIGTPNAKIFNGDSSCAAMDYIAGFNSRSDGLVDFRSACGNADANPDNGPGYSAPLATQIFYCANSVKKPNHYPWFMINQNHYDIAMPTYHCGLEDNPCETLLYKDGGFQVDATYAKRSALEVLRDRLTKNSGGKKPVQLRTVLGI